MISTLIKKYNLNILGEDEKYILFEKDGYVHKIPKASISRVRFDSVSTMLNSSKLAYYNDKILANTNLKAMSIDGDFVIILNTKTNRILFWSLTRNLDVEVIERQTEKPSKYRQLIIDKLGNNFNYDKCYPTHSRDKVIIGCPIHGEWQTTVTSVLWNNSSCPMCSREAKGFHRTSFVTACRKNNGGIGLLYVVRIKSKDESFIKVPKTHRSLAYGM